MPIDLDAVVERIVEAARNRYDITGKRVVYGKEYDRALTKRVKAILEEAWDEPENG